jgi:hypothetical protein
LSSPPAAGWSSGGFLGGNLGGSDGFGLDGSGVDSLVIPPEHGGGFGYLAISIPDVSATKGPVCRVGSSSCSMREGWREGSAGLGRGGGATGPSPGAYLLVGGGGAKLAGSFRTYGSEYCGDVSLSSDLPAQSFYTSDKSESEFIIK